VVLGEFGRAHSLKGEVRLKSSTADPLAVVSYSPLRTDDGRKVTLTRVRPAPGAAPDILIAVVEGVTTREAAEALNRTRLLLERDRLPPAEDEDEFLLADLVGLSVETPDGKPLGRVVGVPNYGGGDLLEIAPVKRGPTGLMPFTKAFVPVVDIKAGRIVADAPDDLFTPAKPEPDDPDAPVDAPPRRPKRKPETPR
jgi:16S rRNA processing protein RimM